MILPLIWNRTFILYILTKMVIYIWHSLQLFQTRFIIEKNTILVTFWHQLRNILITLWQQYEARMVQFSQTKWKQNEGYMYLVP